MLARTQTHWESRAQTHTPVLALLCLRWSHHKHTHTSITSILVSRSSREMHRDIKIHTSYTTQVGQLNSIRFSAPDGSEESFQLINNVSSTCIKLNRCLLVIMNVLMGLSDRSGAQTNGNSFIIILFFLPPYLSVAKSLLICLPSLQPSLLSHFFVLDSVVTLFFVSSHLRFTFIKGKSNSIGAKTWLLNYVLPLSELVDLCFSLSFYEYLTLAPCVALCLWLFASGLCAVQGTDEKPEILSHTLDPQHHQLCLPRTSHCCVFSWGACQNRPTVSRAVVQQAENPLRQERSASIFPQCGELMIFI